MTKVMLMTELILMPMSCAVSKSRDTARMAMPILVFWIRMTNTTTSKIVKMGVIMVIRLTFRLPTCITWVRNGMSGYARAIPPVI